MYWAQHLYSSPNIIKFTHTIEDETGRAYRTYVQINNAYKFWVRKTDGKRSLGRNRSI